MEQLSRQQIDEKLRLLDKWQLDGAAIKKSWTFKDFQEAMQFIQRVADIAEEMDHHPELFNVYNRVELRFTTHDAGGLTARDFEIASRIDRL